jgi:hypothetical protein
VIELCNVLKKLLDQVSGNLEFLREDSILADLAWSLFLVESWTRNTTAELLERLALGKALIGYRQMLESRVNAYAKHEWLRLRVLLRFSQ